MLTCVFVRWNTSRDFSEDGTGQVITSSLPLQGIRLQATGEGAPENATWAVAVTNAS